MKFRLAPGKSAHRQAGIQPKVIPIGNGNAQVLCDPAAGNIDAMHDLAGQIAAAPKAVIQSFPVHLYCANFV